MPCYKPLQGWRSRFKNDSGKRSIVFSKADAYVDQPIEVPCGRCIGCRLERSRQWALRIMHESSFHDSSIFVTLTYDDDHIPSDYSLNKRHFQNFIRELRRVTKTRIRYFHCGEYGDQYSRPHYHAIIFGFDPPDKVLVSERDGNQVFSSDFLAKIWGKGFIEIGSVTFESAAYVARYCMKKVSLSEYEGRTEDERLEKLRRHYQITCPITGVIYDRIPEYVTMSLKPAIGRPWIDKYVNDVFPRDSVVNRGIELRPPKYYFKVFDLGNFNYHLYQHLDADNQLNYLFSFMTTNSVIAELKGKRVRQAKANASNNTPSRLRVREQVKTAQISALKRSLE